MVTYKTRLLLLFTWLSRQRTNHSLPAPSCVHKTHHTYPC